MPAERKMDMLQAIQAKFDLGNNANTKRWVYLGISTSWRNWKAELKKKYYNPYHTIRERLEHCPTRVNPDQWAWIITFWGSQERVARSRRNSRNREAQAMSHTAGTKSFARIRDEAAPDQIEMFRMTHARRDGQLVDQASEDVMLNESLSQQPESSQNSTTREAIFPQVMGEDRRGRVRTFGLGVTHSDIYGPQASIAEARAAAVESARIAKMERAQRIALQEEVVHMRTQLNQLMTWMQSFTGSGPSSSSSGACFLQHKDPLQLIGCWKSSVLMMITSLLSQNLRLNGRWKANTDPSKKFIRELQRIPTVSSSGAEVPASNGEIDLWVLVVLGDGPGRGRICRNLGIWLHCMLEGFLGELGLRVVRDGDSGELKRRKR
ncbi:hypothetical protein AAC387_Pa07g3625 [Persea americana]